MPESKPHKARAALFRRRSLPLRAVLPLILLALALTAATGQHRLDGPVGGGLNPRQRRADMMQQQRRVGPTFNARPSAGNAPASGGEYTFVRVIYDSPNAYYGRRRMGTWATDFPEADNHFITGIREWAGTNLNISQRPEQLQFTDERLFDYPIIYIVEPGFMQLSDEEAARLREYVLRGGFLFLDDFWGESEWQHVSEQLKKALPEYEIKDLPLNHPIFHSYLDVEEIVQVPNIYNAQIGITSEKGGVVPHYMGIEDKQGRIVGFIARNCDLGDAWEWINDSRYPVKYGLAAYKVGINVVIYAMSH
jgi:Domain of unknown function (DUF4159)